MAVVAWQLAGTAIVDRLTLTILVASALLVIKFRINSAWVIAGAALCGWFSH
jgi:chromate transporter